MAVRGSRFDSPADSLGFLLWRATLRWQRAVGEALAPFELTHVQFVLLAALVWLDEPPTQRELARTAATDEMMTSQVVRALESRGLLDRRTDPQDARRRRLQATRAGRDLAAQAIVAVEAVDDGFFRDPAAALPVLRSLADV